MTVNDVNSLKLGIVKMPTSKVNGSYTILLVGEAGVGKSSLLKLIANVLLGNDVDHYDLDILNHSCKERGAVGPTVSPHLYEITSVNGILFRILDTPGLAGISCIEQDEIHKENIVKYIEQHVDFVDAVLILSDGTFRGTKTTVGMENIFSALSALLPKTLVSNIAYIFTHTFGPGFWGFSQIAPEALKNAPTFLLENPIVPGNGPKHHPDMKETAKSREGRALKTLMRLFNWLDGLEPQSATEILSLYEDYQNIEAMAVDLLDLRHLEIETEILMITLKEHSADKDVFSDFEKTVDTPVLRQPSTTTRNIDNGVLVDEDMKKKWDEAKDGKERTAALIAVNEMVLHGLKQVSGCATGDLVQLVERYIRLSLVGSCSAQVRSAMEQESMKLARIDGISTPERVTESLDHMKRELKPLKRVEERTQKEKGMLE